jgi:hypothetical protein
VEISRLRKAAVMTTTMMMTAEMLRKVMMMTMMMAASLLHRVMMTMASQPQHRQAMMVTIMILLRQEGMAMTRQQGRFLQEEMKALRHQLEMMHHLRYF